MAEKKQPDLNGYLITRTWFEFCANNLYTLNITSNHTAVFLYISNVWNITGQPKIFSIPTGHSALFLKISTKTYYKVIDDLVAWNFLIIKSKGKNKTTAPTIQYGNVFHSRLHSELHSKVVSEVDSKSHLIEPKNIEPLNKEVAKATKKGISLEEFRLLIQQAISTCAFTDKFTEEAKKHFLSWATTENKITALKKIKTDLAKYFQKEIDYLSKYAPNQIEFMLELAQRKSYIGYVEKNLPEPQKPRPKVFEELYGGMDNGKQKPKVEEVRETDEEMLDRLLGKQDEKRS